MFRIALVALSLCTPAASEAAWKEATSKHFIVYSEGSEEGLRQTITKLEKYDFLLRWGSKVKQASSPIKLKIYMMKDMGAVQETLPYGGGGVAGYYTTSPRGPIAVSLRTGEGLGGQMTPEEVLFHEYAHHFMFQYFPATYPSWYSEGFAEYYGTAKVLENDVIEVGHAARQRYASFEDNAWLPLEKMLTAKSYSDVGGNIYLLYAQGWLLVHYLANNKERSGQLAQYLSAINSGTPYDKAMNDAFGPGAKKLNAELRSYSTKGRLTAISVPFKTIDVGQISIRALDPSEDALIDEDIALGAGVPKRIAGKFAERVRSRTAKFPKSAYALRILTEAERAAGNHSAAAVAVERWLTLSPRDGRAMMHKAELQMEALKNSKSSDKAAWDSARKLIVEASKASPGTPEILLAYFNSFKSEGVMPPAGAQNALVRAFELLPQDEFIRHVVASDFEKRGMIAEAIAIIKPAAFELHGDSDDPKKKKKLEEMREKHRTLSDDRTETAREMLERLEKKLTETKKAA